MFLITNRFPVLLEYLLIQVSFYLIQKVHCYLLAASSFLFSLGYEAFKGTGLEEATALHKHAAGKVFLGLFVANFLGSAAHQLIELAIDDLSTAIGSCHLVTCFSLLFELLPHIRARHPKSQLDCVVDHPQSLRIIRESRLHHQLFI